MGYAPDCTVGSATILFGKACNLCLTLPQALNRDRKRSLKFYYRQFLKLAAVQEALGHLFNPFVLFALGWSVFVLCLTIYFVTQTESTMDLPKMYYYDKNYTEEILDIMRVSWRKTTYFNVGWSILQIVLAICHIVTICYTGTYTNEGSRNILRTVLNAVPEDETENDRFQVTCFMHKISTQYMWGMSVWRAFPLERSVFFTIVSLIITYAFLLLKLKGQNADSADVSTILPSPQTPDEFVEVLLNNTGVPLLN